MGAAVFAYWRGITDEQREAQPGFRNDCKAWGNWMAEIHQNDNAEAALIEADLAPLLTFTTAGIEDDDVDWVTPDELAAAAVRLRVLLQQGHSAALRALTVYEIGANGVDSVEEEMSADLEDVAELAHWAKSAGVKKMTIEVNW
jgi:hypothetical protein